MKFTVDETGKLKRVFSDVIDEYFPKLKILKFIYVWRDSEKFDDGQLIAAEVFKLSNRDRDLWGFDVRVEIDEAFWTKQSKEDKKKLVYHELSHIQLDMEVDKDTGEETDEVKTDAEDRISFFIVNHDLVLRRFKRELKKFGLSETEREILEFLQRIDKKFQHE